MEFLSFFFISAYRNFFAAQRKIEKMILYKVPIAIQMHIAPNKMAK